MIGIRHVFLALVAAAAIAAPALAGPKRVVSINLCTDQLAMLIGAPGQVVSVSYLAQDPRTSAMAEEARAYKANRGLAEEIFLMRPDLVLAGTYTPRSTVEMLRHLGIEVAEFAPATDLDDIRDRMALMGALLGRAHAARALTERFDADLVAARASHGPRPRAATYYANNYTSGDDTLASAVLDAAGLVNIAIELGLTGGGTLPLEQLVMQMPDLIVTERRYRTPARAQQPLDHPALQVLRTKAGRAPVTDRDWGCGTPFVIAAIRRLVAARDAVLRRDSTAQATPDPKWRR